MGGVQCTLGREVQAAEKDGAWVPPASPGSRAPQRRKLQAWKESLSSYWEAWTPPSLPGLTAETTWKPRPHSARDGEGTAVQAAQASSSSVLLPPRQGHTAACASAPFSELQCSPYWSFFLRATPSSPSRSGPQWPRAGVFSSSVKPDPSWLEPGAWVTALNE